jgi:hypothetical protein
MENERKFAIYVTSYEVSKGKKTPVLIHIFPGNTLDEALGYAKSHLITDYFFSSTFVREMKWAGDKIELEYEGLVVGMGRTDPKKIFAMLHDEAMEVNKQQEKEGVVKAIGRIASNQ